MISCIVRVCVCVCAIKFKREGKSEASEGIPVYNCYNVTIAVSWMFHNVKQICKGFIKY